MSDNIYSDLTDLFRVTFKIPKLEIFPTTSSSDIAEWDSLNNIKLIFILQEQFYKKELDQLYNISYHPIFLFPSYNVSYQIL